MPIQTSALKAKIGERIMNEPILPNHPSWLLQYLVKCQIGYPGKAKTIGSPLAKRLTDHGGGKRLSITAPQVGRPLVWLRDCIVRDRLCSVQPTTYLTTIV